MKRNPNSMVWKTPLWFEGTPAASLGFLHKHLYLLSVFLFVEGGYLNVLSLYSMIIVKIKYNKVCANILHTVNYKVLRDPKMMIAYLLTLLFINKYALKHL